MKILSFETIANKKDLLTAFLRSRLAIVDETNDTGEALDLVKFYDYDVVLLRLSEDRLGDLDIVRKLRLARVRAPIVAVARTLNEAARLRVLQAGADDLIVEALSHEEVFIKVQNLIRRSRGFQDNALRIGAHQERIPDRRDSRTPQRCGAEQGGHIGPSLWRLG